MQKRAAVLICTAAVSRLPSSGDDSDTNIKEGKGLGAKFKFVSEGCSPLSDGGTGEGEGPRIGSASGRLVTSNGDGDSVSNMVFDGGSEGIKLGTLLLEPLRLGERLLEGASVSDGLNEGEVLPERVDDCGFTGS